MILNDDVKDLSLRDYFAGQALAGITSADGIDWLKATPANIAEAAYNFADAMLSYRKNMFVRPE